MRLFCAAVMAFCVVGISANADGVSGLYQTEAGDSGGVLHVAFEACAKDEGLTCATIMAAFDKDRVEVADYAHLGKPIVWDMREIGGGKFGNGKIWDPSSDKTYKSKMRVRGTALRVLGCVGPICKTQNWQKVK